MRHHLRPRRTALVGVCLATTATVDLTACGSGTAKPKEPFAGMSGGEIAEKAFKATAGAKSLRVAGEMADEGELVSMDMALDNTGKCVGTLGANKEGSVDVIAPGDIVYLKYDEEFLRAQSKGEPSFSVQKTVDAVANRWVKTRPTGGDTKATARNCDLDVLLADMKDPRPAVRRGATTTVDGTPAIKLTEGNGEDEFTAYVATKGKPYLLRIGRATDGKPETLTFSDYDKPVKATPPTGDILDLDS